VQEQPQKGDTHCGRDASALENVTAPPRYVPVQCSPIVAVVGARVLLRWG
jgi:hypothetical protein